MAFQTNDLSVLAYANGFTLWHYRTADEEGGYDYFDPAHGMLRTGDIIMANFNVDGEIRSGLLAVSSNAGGRVRCRSSSLWSQAHA